MNILTRCRARSERALRPLCAAISVTLLGGLLAMPLPGQAQVNVLQFHNDSFNSGLNPNETLLTPSNVPTGFGKLFTQTVDGVVYAQPLILTGVAITNSGVQNGMHNVVFVATEHDSVYAFDADTNLGNNANPLWKTSFLTGPTGTTVTTVPYTDVSCGQITPEIGITGTPVINSNAGILYVAVFTKEVTGGTTAYVHRLHALNVSDGTEVAGWPITITASVTVSGTTSTLTPKSYKTRPGLLLLNGVVYVSFSSHCDISPYHGWLIGYDTTTLAQTAVFNTTPTGSQASLWMGGCAPAVDQNGYIFLNTANGTASASMSNYGDSFVKLSADALTVQDFFTPFNQSTLSSNDEDTGSGGLMLLPDSAGSGTHQHLLTGAGKEGRIYLLDRDTLGGTQSGSDTGAVQTIPNAVGAVAKEECFGTAACFNNVVYYIGNTDNLKGFTIANAQFNTTPAKSSVTFSSPGATPSISANQIAANPAATGIVWAIDNSGTNAILYAFTATPSGTTLTQLYSSSADSARDSIGAAAVKFSTPTIANGKVYVGTQSSVAIFGLLPANVSGTITTQGCAPNSEALTFTFRPSFGADVVFTATPAANGTFALANVPAGSYTLSIQGPKYLRKDVTVSTTTGAVTGVTATLLTGDINGDNVIDLKDFSALATAFGTTPASADWNADADLNCDGQIDLKDFALFAANYGKAGDP